MSLDRRCLLIGGGTVLALIAGPGLILAQNTAFRVDFTWEGTTSCFDPRSPPFTLNGVPTGTKRLYLMMKDLDAPTFPHGGGTIAYTGQNQIGRGAFSYKGPCPPSGQHTYQWTVVAQDSTGNILATAIVAKKFPAR
jgi:phosphatidylethanolamine-binding protein (PEBP) family uncharacterized protein